MKCKRKIFAFCFFLISTFVYSYDNDMIMYKADYWIYDAINGLCAEAGIVPLSGNAPLTSGEIKLTLNQIDEEKLSPNGKLLLEKCYSLLSGRRNLVNAGAFGFYANPSLTPELYLRTNPEIDISFPYYYKNYFLGCDFGFGFSKYFYIETEPFLSRCHSDIHQFGNFHNIPLDLTHTEFEQPRWAYGSMGYAGKNWGVNFVLGKEGLRHGNSILGSVCYNDTFETDFYSQLNLYTERFKYSMDITEVDINRFLYLHQIEFKPYFKNLKISCIEGNLVNAPFELRFLNPLMIMHSFAGWLSYITEEEKNWYGEEAHFCAYLCFLVEYNPIKNLRTYFNFSQTEIQWPWEQSSIPNGMGFQLGADYRWNGFYDGYWILSGEAVYTNPWLYVKNGAEWSLYSHRDSKNFPNNWDDINSWIGLPEGPDCIGGKLKFSYVKYDKFEADVSWKFTAHGENGFGLFNQKNENGYYDYFPSVKEKHAKTEEEKKNALESAENLGLHGVVSYKNVISFGGTYVFNRFVSLSGKIDYSFIFNHNNIQDNFQHGAEFDLSCTCKLF